MLEYYADIKRYFWRYFWKVKRQGSTFPKVAFNKNITVNVYLNVTLMCKVKINLIKKMIVASRRSWFGYFTLLCRWACLQKHLWERNPILTACMDNWGFLPRFELANPNCKPECGFLFPSLYPLGEVKYISLKILLMRKVCSLHKQYLNRFFWY